MATKIHYFILLVVFFPINLGAQSLQNELTNWMSNFYTLRELKTSDDNKWIAVKQTNATTKTAILIYHRGKSFPSFVVDHDASFHFIDNNTLYLKTIAKTELIDLNSNTTHTFKDYKIAGLLPSKSGIYTLDKDSTLSFFNNKASLLKSWKKIAFLKLEENNLLLSQKKGNAFTFFNPLSNIKSTYNSTKTPITFYYQNDSWLLVEKDNNGKLWLTLLNNHAEKIQSTTLPTEIIPIKISYATTTSPSIIVVDIKNKMQRPSKEEVEMWSTYDPLLRYKREGLTTRIYATWDLKTNNWTTWNINNTERHILLPGTNKSIRYDLKEKNNYEDFNFKADLWIKDYDNETQKLWAKGVFSITASKDKTLLMAYNENENIWHLLNTQSGKSTTLPGNYKEPIFSEDNSTIYLTNNNQILVYNIPTATYKIIYQNNQIESLKIVNAKRNNDYTHITGIQFSSSYLPKKTPLILKTFYHNNNEALFAINENNKVQCLIPSSPIKLKDFKIALNNSQITALQEEYNKPTYIINYNLKTNNAFTIHPSTDKNEHLLRREIISFATNKNKNQKGLLYYPTNFDPRKTYPMVVLVYEKQQYKANNYLVPEMSFDGFSPRIFMEKGYFVFLPDILVKESSPAGNEATYQLEQALKEVDNFPYIDKIKRALVGHSFGAYQTLLAATKPLNFATYIAGASTSDIIAKYYSYYEPFQAFNYSRIMFSQFNMKVPFEDNSTLYYENNPIHKVKNVKAPILLWVGQNDKNTPPSSTMAFYIGLLKNNKTGVALFYPNEDHALAINSPASTDLTLRILDWCEYFLKDKKDIPWINDQLKKEAY